MKKRTTKKLALTKRTLRTLDHGDLSRVGGGEDDKTPWYGKVLGALTVSCRGDDGDGDASMGIRG